MSCVSHLVITSTGVFRDRHTYLKGQQAKVHIDQVRYITCCGTHYIRIQIHCQVYFVDPAQQNPTPMDILMRVLLVCATIRRTFTLTGDRTLHQRQLFFHHTGQRSIAQRPGGTHKNLGGGDLSLLILWADARTMDTRVSIFLGLFKFSSHGTFQPRDLQDLQVSGLKFLRTQDVLSRSFPGRPGTYLGGYLRKKQSKICKKSIEKYCFLFLQVAVLLETLMDTQ